jgi:hypothetical protein
MTYNPIVTTLKSIQHIKAEEGVIQGGANSSTHFNLATLDVVRKTRDITGPNGLVRVYADDMNCTAPAPQILDVLDYHNGKEVRDKGLIPNFIKYKCLLPPAIHDDTLQKFVDDLTRRGLHPDNILFHPNTTRNGVVIDDPDGKYGSLVMGIPIGSTQFVRREIDEINNELHRQFNKIANLKDAQIQLLFMRQCLDATITHLCRGLTPSQSASVTDTYTALQRQALCKIAGVSTISDLQFDLGRCSGDKGGLGLLNANTIAHGAFVASLIATLPHLNESLPEVRQEINDYIDNNIAPSSPTLQEFIASVQLIAAIDKKITLRGLIDLPQTKHKHLQRRLNSKFKELHEDTTLHNIQNHDDKQFWKHVQSGATAEAAAWLQAVPDG